MLDQIAHHGGVSLQVKATGDLEVDEHHTMEDVGIALGEALRKALRDGGVIGSQSESPFLLPEVVKQLQKFTGKFFDYTAYGMFYVPTYPMGQIGICIGGVGVDATCVQRSMSDSLQRQLRYYNPEIHEACFKLPEFVKNMLKKESD